MRRSLRGKKNSVILLKSFFRDPKFALRDAENGSRLKSLGENLRRFRNGYYSFAGSTVPSIGRL